MLAEQVSQLGLFAKRRKFPESRTSIGLQSFCKPLGFLMHAVPYWNLKPLDGLVTQFRVGQGRKLGSCWSSRNGVAKGFRGSVTTVGG